jgi:hypothetical protein
MFGKTGCNFSNVFIRHRAAVGLGAFGAIIKGVCVVGADVALTVWVVKLAIDGRWGLAALLFFIGIPILSFIVDLASGLLVALIVGLAVIVGWKAPAPLDASALDDEDDVSWRSE